MTLFFLINWSLQLNLKATGIKAFSSHYLMASEIKPSTTFIDLGANAGTFYMAIAQTFKCSGYAIEASPELYKNLPRYPGIQKYNYAITSEDRYVKLYLSTNPEANSLFHDISRHWGDCGCVEIEGLWNS